MSRGNRRRWSLRLARWHRFAGLTAALFTLIRAVSGALLQHAPRLGLDHAPVGSAAVARWFGVEIAEVRGWRLDGRWLLAAGTGLWLDGRRLGDGGARATGAVTTPFGFAVAVGGNVRLFDAQGRPVERLRAGAALPVRVERIGRAPHGSVVLAGPAGHWQPAGGWLSFERYHGKVAAWQGAVEPPRAVAAAVRERELARAISWERLLLAVHSGRIAGTAGKVVMDVAALALIVLALSGLYLWWRRR